MRVAVTGAGGLIGRRLVSELTTAGDSVVRLVRRGPSLSPSPGPSPSPSPREVWWDPRAERQDLRELEGVEAVVHLAGENVAAGRWTARRKQELTTSRVQATRGLCEGLAGLRQGPRVLISASAVGWYGNRGDAWLDETSAAGTGFLADLAQAWEQATSPALDAGIRVVRMRFGIVLATEGGALAKMLTPVRWGLGGPMGHGKQYWSWITLRDACAAVRHGLTVEALRGPVNAVSPQAVTNREFIQTLAHLLHRPACFPAPAAVLRCVLGEMADEMLLSSTRVKPSVLTRSGFSFQDAELEKALSCLLGRSP